MSYSVHKEFLPLTRKEVEVALSFLPVFLSEGFSAGNVVEEEGHFPYFKYIDEVRQFTDTLYQNGWIIEFNWPEFQDEAIQYYQHPDLLDSADIETLRKLLTLNVRKDRFCEGHLADMIENGHIAAILKRLRDISNGDEIR